ncbi:MAG: hypothetical protein IJY70_01885 [Clostridia bacterium]|nr:hypothetical protein [Clostridia bacterium]
MEKARNSDGELSSLLLTLGVMPSVAGFEYIKSAVKQYNDCDGNMNEICSNIASYNKVSKGSVERDIRTALVNAYHRGWLIRLNDLIGVDYVSPTARLKAKEFIAIVAEYIKIRNCEKTKNH